MKRRVPAKVQLKRFLRMVLPAALVLLSGILIVGGILTYRITHGEAVQESLKPSHYLLPSMDVSWVSADGYQLEGWWIPGLKDAACIVLAPGYGMSRSNVLSLAAGLHEIGFHVLTYDQRGSGGAPRGTGTMGLRETDDLLAAFDFAHSRAGVNSDRVGVWGADVGAHAALNAAALRPEVKAIAVDSAYDSVWDFIGVRIHEDFGSGSRVLESVCRMMLRAYVLASAESLGERLSLQKLADCSILFIQGENRKELGRMTAELYDQVQPQKEMVELPSSRTRHMSGEEIKSYDRLVTNFFQLHLR